MVWIKLILKWLLGGFFMFAGTNHFLRPEFFMRIMPPYIPYHREMVYLSGVFEFLLGLLLLIPRFTVLAAWGLIALLVAVFPANLHMALNADKFSNFTPTALWIRLPLQGVLIAWAYWYTRTTK